MIEIKLIIKDIGNGLINHYCSCTNVGEHTQEELKDSLIIRDLLQNHSQTCIVKGGTITSIERPENW